MDKMIRYFLLRLIGKTLTQQERLHVYFQLLSDGEHTMDEVLECERSLEGSIHTFSGGGVIRDADHFYKLMLQHGYTINDVRVLNGEEPVKYGGLMSVRHGDDEHLYKNIP